MSKMRIVRPLRHGNELTSSAGICGGRFYSEDTRKISVDLHQGRAGLQQVSCDTTVWRLRCRCSSVSRLSSSSVSLSVRSRLLLLSPGRLGGMVEEAVMAEVAAEEDSAEAGMVEAEAEAEAEADLAVAFIQGEVRD
jgi:hypothetical protein